MWIKGGELFGMYYVTSNFFFMAVELQTYPHLQHTNLMKQHLVQSIASKEDVQILWSILSLDISEDNQSQEVSKKY